MEKISLGQLHLPSQGDVKEPESCLSEALLTADLCVFSHLSRRAVCMCVSVCARACVCVSDEGCLFACQLVHFWTCARKCETLKDPSLSSRCVNEQSVLLIFSQAYPAPAPALPVVTGKPWQFKSVDIVLAVGSAYAEDISLCFSAICCKTNRCIPDGRQSRYRQEGERSRGKQIHTAQ